MWLEILLLGAIAAWLCVSIFWIKKRKKSGCSGCCEGCSGCKKH